MSFSSDFIIGYPGEEEEDFQKTMNLVKEIKFINSYSFIFSARPGTPASKLQRIDNVIAKDRLKIIQNELSLWLHLNPLKNLESEISFQLDHK